MYEYRAKYLDNYDGDTIKFEIDLGFEIYHRITVRLLDVYCPEINSKIETEKQLALAAKKFTQLFLNSGVIIVKTYKDKKDKYGRYLAEIKVIGKSNTLNTELKFNKFSI